MKEIKFNKSSARSLFQLKLDKLLQAYANALMLLMTFIYILMRILKQ